MYVGLTLANSWKTLRASQSTFLLMENASLNQNASLNLFEYSDSTETYLGFLPCFTNSGGKVLPFIVSIFWLLKIFFLLKLYFIFSKLHFCLYFNSNMNPWISLFICLIRKTILNTNQLFPVDYQTENIYITHIHLLSIPKCIHFEA